jgi:hypothetical protein
VGRTQPSSCDSPLEPSAAHPRGYSSAALWPMRDTRPALGALLSAANAANRNDLLRQAQVMDAKGQFPVAKPLSSQ